MNKKLLRIVAALASAIFCLTSCSEKQNNDPQKETLSLFSLDGVNATALTIGANSGSASVRLMASSSWTAKPDAQSSWISVAPSEGPAGARQLTISASDNDSEDTRTGKLTFYINDVAVNSLSVTQNGKSAPIIPPANVPIADLLNVVFQNNGTAQDYSTSRMTVERIPGTSLVNYQNSDLNMCVAHFNQPLGESVTNGYYKVDYSTNEKMQQGLADGHSLEVVFKIDSKSDGSKEVKMFSSMGSGGTGFLISSSSKGCVLTFLPNVSQTGTSTWRWAQSQINPEPGHYYHAVGVWNKAAGTAQIYVDGELKGSVAAEGDLVFPSSTSCWWFGIGVDAGTSGGESAWKGDVAVARIYDDPLTAKQVKTLYDQIKQPLPVSTMNVNNLMFMSDCEIAPTYKYYIYGEGIQEGDKVRFDALSGNLESEIYETTIEKDCAKVVIPDSFKGGAYRMMLIRGDEEYPLGSTKLTKSDNPSNIGGTRVVAHRGYHKNGASENSIAALKNAQSLGVYGAEFDTWITTDGVVVINHDATVPGDSHKIQESTYAQIKDLVLGNGEKLPTLDDYLTQLQKNPNMKGILEIKSHTKREDNNRVTDACIAAVKEKGLTSQIEWIAFDYTNCQRVIAALPEAMVQYLGGNVLPSKIKADGFGGIDYSNAVLTAHPEYVTDAHKLGLLVNAWTINSTADMTKYIVMGADYITTDNPEILKTMVSRVYISM